MQTHDCAYATANSEKTNVNTPYHHQLIISCYCHMTRYELQKCPQNVTVPVVLFDFLLSTAQ